MGKMDLMKRVDPEACDPWYTEQFQKLITEREGAAEMSRAKTDYVDGT
jgi:hypothetical protein